MPRLSAAEIKRRFIDEHPKCCFCGGDEPATDMDHIPNRAMFIERAWPEGYIFPACRKCNENTTDQENIVSIIARSGIGSSSTPDAQRMLERITNLASSQPQITKELLSASANDKRRALRRLGIEKDPHSFLKDLSVFKLEGPHVTNALQIYFKKLTLALHYYHTEHIASNASQILIRWYANSNFHGNEIPLDLLNDLHGVQLNAMRNNTLLNDQFKYKYSCSEEGTASVFYVVLHEVFSFFGMVADFGETIEFPEADRTQLGSYVSTPFRY